MRPPLEPRATLNGADTIWTACAAIGEELDAWSSRLVDQTARYTERDILHVADLAARVAEMRNGHRRVARALTPTDDLGGMYESPVSGDAATALLEQLGERAETTLNGVRSRAEVPLVIAIATEPPIDVPAERVQHEIELQPIRAATIVVVDDAEEPALKRTVNSRRLLTELLTALGALLVLFVVYSIFGTGLAGARSQHRLDRSFDQRLKASISAEQQSGTQAQPSGVLGAEPATSAVNNAASDPPALADRGVPVAVISLSTIGRREIMVQGTRASELAQGPGHLRSTPLPGQPGNAVVYGRRTTYGGPFERLDDLHRGDPIDVTTTQGVFRYVVQGVRRVTAGEPSPAAASLQNQLTLITSDEAYSTSGSLVATALLQGDPAAVPTSADGVAAAPPVLSPDELGTTRTDADWALMLIWSQALVLAYLGARWLYRHWLPWSSWLVSAPIVLLVAFGWLDSMTRLLPNTL